MTAILKREFASYFTSPLGYVYLAVFYGFSGLFLWITCLSSGSADMQYVFLWMFFIMMILIPILTMRTMADDKRQKTDQLTLTSPVSLFGLVAGKFLAAFFILLFLISTCIPYLHRWCGEVWGECFWNEYHMLWYFSGYLGYSVIAHYIRKHLTWSRRRRFVTGLILMTAGAVATILSFYVQAVPGVIHPTPVIEIGWSMCTINCVALTTGTFLLFTCIRSTSAPAFITRKELSQLGISN